jgi:elongation factor G
LIPVLCGAALRDLGIQPILDAVCDFLPSPLDRPPAQGMNPETGEPIVRESGLSTPFSALVFKVVATANVDVFWIRIYSGSLGMDERCYQPRIKSQMRLRRILRLHADRSEPVESARCGDILAVPGLKNVITGDTLCTLDNPITYEPIHFPQTVVSMAVETRTSSDRDKVFDAVARLMREDPTLNSHTDEETGQLILSGMGELHLEVTRNRMQREFNITAFFGRPRVSYRETAVERGVGKGEFEKKINDIMVTGRATVEVVHRPRPAGDRSMPPVEIDLSRASRLLTPAQQREAREILFQGCNSGGTHGYPVVDVSVRIIDIRHNDPPDPLVPLLGSLSLALRDALAQAQTVVLEPVMKLEVRAPGDCLGAVMKDLGSRRAEIHETMLLGDGALVHGLVPLAEMFGYSTQIRSLTQGRGSFSMEPYDYQSAKSWI